MSRVWINKRNQTQSARAVRHHNVLVWWVSFRINVWTTITLYLHIIYFKLFKTIYFNQSNILIPPVIFIIYLLKFDKYLLFSFVSLAWPRWRLKKRVLYTMIQILPLSARFWTNMENYWEFLKFHSILFKHISRTPVLVSWFGRNWYLKGVVYLAHKDWFPCFCSEQLQALNLFGRNAWVYLVKNVSDYGSKVTFVRLMAN